MDRCLELKLIHRVLHAVQQRTTEMSDNISSNPVENYRSTDRFEREREILFRKFPLVVGFSSQVARPGDFFTHDLCDVPILVTRDKEGKLNAFMNVCRHRGAPLVAEPCGSGRDSFVCPFHGWRYSSGGALQTLTFADCFPGFDRSKYGLISLPVAERYGMVFVIPTPGMELDIDDYLGPLIRDLDSFGFDRHVVVYPTMSRRRMNWKLQMDTSLENYHFGFLHPKTGGTRFLHHLAVFDWVYPNCRLIAPQRSITKLVGTDPSTWRILDHAGLLYSIFPNTCVFCNEGNAWVLSAFPIDADTTLLRGGMLVPDEPVTPEITQARKGSNTLYWATMEEDVSIGVAIQSTLRSGANTEFVFGRSEYILRNFHGAVEDALHGKLTCNTMCEASRAARSGEPALESGSATSSILR